MNTSDFRLHPSAFGIAAAAMLALASAASAADSYPSRPVRVVVPFTPGTGMDIIARNVGPRLAERIGQPVVIDNRPGASGNLGAELVARAAPDGYTMMVSGNPLVTSPHLYGNVPFKPLTDFTPISLAAWGTLILVTHPSAKIASLPDLVARAKSSPGKINYGSPGIGTPHHLAMELLKNTTGANLTHVPYKGTAGAITDLLGGQIAAMFVPIHVALPHVKSGRLVALAVGSPKRHPTAPDLPTLAELGVAGVESDIWYGFVAPKGTPKDVIAKLNAELKSILALPEVQASFAAQGMDIATSTPEEFQALEERDYARWGKVVVDAKITPE